MRGAAGVHNVDALTTLSAQVTSLTNMVKATATAPTTVNQIAEVSCVYYVLRIQLQSIMWAILINKIKAIHFQTPIT